MAETLVPRDRYLVESAIAWIAWAHRENRRLVRERDAAVKAQDKILGEIKRSLLALGGSNDAPVAILHKGEYLADGIARVVNERNALRAEKEQMIERLRIFG